MKKIAFFGMAALIVLLAAFAIVSCEFFDTPEAKKVPVVEVEDSLFINVNGSVGRPDGRSVRSLTGPTAEGGTTFYEATFMDSGNNYIRTTWDWSTDGSIQLLSDTYDVVVLAGRGEDRTLLAMGYISEVHNRTNANVTLADRTDPVVILPDTWGLTITLYPLLTNVGGSVRHILGVAQDWERDTSTFLITSGDFIGSGDPEDYILDNVAVDSFGNKVPIFHIETGDGVTDPTATATWEFLVGGGLPWSTDPTPAGNKIADYDDVIFVHELNGRVKQAGFSPKGSLETPSLLARAEYMGPNGVAPSTSVQTPITGGIFDLEFQVKANEHGLTQIAIEVPVFAMHPTLGNPQTWWIRGGLNSSLNDVGGNPTTGLDSPAIQGGAIVIGFGNLASIPDIGLYPGGPPTPPGTPITDFGTIVFSNVPAPAVDSASVNATISSTEFTVASATWAPQAGSSFPVLTTFGAAPNVYELTIVLTPNAGFVFGPGATIPLAVPHADLSVGTITSNTLIVTFTAP